jgi:hypothetical protein
VAYYPEGKIPAENPLVFRWSYEGTQNPDHFVIKVMEEDSDAGDPRSVVWSKEAIPGVDRSFSAADLSRLALNKRYRWAVEAYERGAAAPSRVGPQSFTLISKEDAARLQARAETVTRLNRARPGEEHLNLALGYYYAKEGMYYFSRRAMAEYLKVPDPTTNTYGEIQKLLKDSLEATATRRDAAAAALGSTNDRAERVRLLGELYALNLRLLDYDAALSNADELISLAGDDAAKATWRSRRAAAAEEKKAVEELLPDPSAAATEPSVPARAPNAASASGTSMAEAPRAASPRAAGARQSAVEVSLSLAPYMSEWYEAEQSFLDENGQGARLDIPSYYMGEDARAMTEGLWSGDITSHIDDGLNKAMLKRSAINMVVVLLRLKAAYMASSGRTQTLDDAWATIPAERTVEGDWRAFNRFARTLYPDTVTLDDPQVIRRRDELVANLSRLWAKPNGASEDRKVQEEYLFYNLLLWRTAPVFQLSIRNKGRGGAAVDLAEVTVEDYRPKDELPYYGPPDPSVGLDFRLDGAQTVARPLRVSLAQGAGKNTLIRIDAVSKGLYRVRVSLKSNGQVVGESKPFNLFF